MRDDQMGLDQAEPLTRKVVRERSIVQEHPGFDVGEIHVATQARSQEILDPSAWNGLGAAARALEAGAPAHALRSLSPLQLRLAVALVEAGVAASEIVRFRSRLVPSLFDRLGAQGERLRTVIGRLALERLPFDRALLDLVGAASLDPRTRLLLEHAVLYEEDDQLVLHESFARAANDGKWLTDADRTQTQRNLGEHHRLLFQHASADLQPERALAHELEAFHHYSQAGALAEIDALHVYFAEQLDALGKSLSLAQRYPDAVRVYERALERDGEDWYAHHYLAFNLDVQGIEASRVEREYREARTLNPDHVWHHGRLTCFYVTRSRMGDAREAWSTAIATLELRVASDPRFYKELHRPLARLLLHRGELELAREVLDGVPPALRHEDAWWDALDRLHARLTEAELEEVVFPPDIPLSERWNGPHLIGEGDRPERWMPGRVAHVDAEQVTIRVAEAPNRFAWLDLDRKTIASEWKGWKQALTAGTFVEIVWAHSQREILVHPPARPDPNLPPLRPAPDRYVRTQRHGRADGAA
ncbi:MAG: tetratricopeptide repeat protein [Sandaracinaceae bacterium]|nr:tetratricopeptide repeat protein [Sandaracinaceae bacterium]